MLQEFNRQKLDSPHGNAVSLQWIAHRAPGGLRTAGGADCTPRAGWIKR